jgi:uncharacterized protein YndB with AHSA1/START domain
MPRRMQAATTQEFQIEAFAPPGQIWAALTTPESTRQFLFGIRLESTWETGSPIMGRLDRGSVLQGEVLFAECPTRLSYMLTAGPEQPEVFVTWEVRATGTRSIGRLSVDETGSSNREEVEASWRPVVAALQGLLLAPRPDHFA